MARYTAAFTITETADWDAGDYFRTDKFRDQVGQNIEFLGQSHDHSGDPGDGATLPTGDMKTILYYGPASPTWG